MTPASDDQPTRRVPPGRPRQPAAGGGGEPPPPPVRTWEEELSDRISSLKNWLVLLGIVSVAALGVAVFAVVKAQDDDGPSRSGASNSQISDLEQRISDLEDDDASSESLSELRKDVSDLDDSVQKLQSADSDAVSSQDLNALQQQVDDLSQRVDDLQSSTP